MRPSSYQTVSVLRTVPGSYSSRTLGRAGTNTDITMDSPARVFLLEAGEPRTLKLFGDDLRLEVHVSSENLGIMKRAVHSLKRARLALLWQLTSRLPGFSHVSAGLGPGLPEPSLSQAPACPIKRLSDGITSAGFCHT